MTNPPVTKDTLILRDLDDDAIDSIVNAIRVGGYIRIGRATGRQSGTGEDGSEFTSQSPGVRGTYARFSDTLTTLETEFKKIEAYSENINSLLEHALRQQRQDDGPDRQVDSRTRPQKRDLQPIKQRITQALDALEGSVGGRDSGSSVLDTLSDLVDQPENRRGRRGSAGASSRGAGVRAGRLTQLGRFVRGSGGPLLAFSAGLDIYDRFMDGQETSEIAAGVGGGIAGSLAGAWLGAKAGAIGGAVVGGPIGGAVGGVLGGLFGGGAGYFGGSGIGDTLYDKYSAAPTPIETFEPQDEKDRSELQAYEAVARAEQQQGRFILASAPGREEEYKRAMGDFPGQGEPINVTPPEQGILSSIWDAAKDTTGRFANMLGFGGPPMGPIQKQENAINENIVGNTKLTGNRKADFQAIMQAAARIGDPQPAVTAAQWALESSYGKKPSGRNNMFGQKGRPGKDDVSWVMTQEVIRGVRIRLPQPFKNYDSPEQGLISHVKKWSARWTTPEMTPLQAAQVIRAKGYATEPNYVALLVSVMRSNGVDVNKPSKQLMMSDLEMRKQNSTNTQFTASAKDGVIHAGRPGLVEIVENRKDGVYVTITSKNREMETYGPLDKAAVKQGDRIAGGQPIGSSAKDTQLVVSMPKSQIPQTSQDVAVAMKAIKNKKNFVMVPQPAPQPPTQLSPQISQSGKAPTPLSPTNTKGMDFPTYYNI